MSCIYLLGSKIINKDNNRKSSNNRDDLAGLDSFALAIYMYTIRLIFVSDFLTYRVQQR